MPQHKGNMERCIEITIHHVHQNKAGGMEMSGFLTARHVQARFDLVRGNLEPVYEALVKIRAAAEAGKLDEVLQLLDGPFSFGHKG